MAPWVLRQKSETGEGLGIEIILQSSASGKKYASVEPNPRNGTLVEVNGGSRFGIFR